MRSVNRACASPQDVSLVGWNDLDELGQFLTPSLSSVRTKPRLFAEAAVHLLAYQMDAPPNVLTLPTRVRVPVQLIARETTAAPPRG